MKDSAPTSGGRGDGTIPRPAWRFSGRRGTPVHKRDSAPATLPPEIRETLAALANERAATSATAAAAGPDATTTAPAQGATTRLDLGSAAASRTTPPVAGAALPVERRSRGERTATVATSSAQSFPPPAPLPQAFDPSVILEPVSELQGQVAEIREQLASLRDADGASSTPVGGLEPASAPVDTPDEGLAETTVPFAESSQLAATGPDASDAPDEGPVLAGAQAGSGTIASEVDETNAEQAQVAGAPAEPVGQAEPVVQSGETEQADADSVAPEVSDTATTTPPSRPVALTAAERRRRAKARAKARALAEQEASQLRRRLFARGREVDHDVAIEPTPLAAADAAPVVTAEASAEPAPTPPAAPVAAAVEPVEPEATTTGPTVAEAGGRPTPAEDDAAVASSPSMVVEAVPAPVVEPAPEETVPQVAAQPDAATQEPPVEASPVWEAAPWTGPEPREGIDRAADAAWGLGRVPILAPVAHGVPSLEDVPLGPPGDGASDLIPEPSNETHDAQEPDMTPPVPPLEWEPVIAPLVGSAPTRHPAGATTSDAAHRDAKPTLAPPTEPTQGEAAVRASHADGEAASAGAAEFVHMRPMAWDPHAEVPPVAPPEEPQPELPAAIARLAGPLFVPADPAETSRAATRETHDRDAGEAARARIARRRSDLDVLVTSLAAPAAAPRD